MVQSLPSLIWDETVIRRYDLSGPRYTSYPTAPQFRENFSRDEWLGAVARSNQENRDLSLYFHIPFCETLCYYCACNKLVTHHKERAMPYLQRVNQEMALQASVFSAGRPVTQLHWGGGTPTYISEGEMTWLMERTREHFLLRKGDDSEFSVEVHPGLASVEKIRHLRRLGFNRISMGVQDFNPQVQEAVNRFNSLQQVQQLVDVSRELGYHSISMDLIYGLPRQNRHTLRETLAHVIDLSPDRLSLFNYAHLPHLFKSQALIREEWLPSAEEKLDILHECIDTLQAAGYVYIGMDHFAKPDDSLVTAQREGSLQRNFQGYSTHGGCDLIAFGVSAISDYGGAIIQNVKKIDDYQSIIDNGEPAYTKGVELTPEDHLRQYVINQIICHLSLGYEDLREKFGIEAHTYFASELAQLAPMEEDGLVVLDEHGLQVLNAGRLLVRRICMVFDQHLNAGAQIHYSKII